MDKAEIETQLKSSIYLMVSKIIENDHDLQPTPMFIASLVELVMNQIINLGEDLELFAKHGGRSTIKNDDVFMVTRKNEILTSVLKEFEKKLEER
ncbi:inner kinetochore subunit Mhf1p [[Candida] jaroonii]|uniref:Inner kinetochore subunit Mhf1p n=1 Tax=[Candida] jaroonii TaxID=467808 RepID=A0ACA9Y960_9ASCO|nr:inner kinetochore subunit Mhf1p [[Candida] jaroonii]